MSNITVLDFMPNGAPVMQMIPTAKPEDALNEAHRRMAMLADSLVIMGENQTLLGIAPEYASLFLLWAQMAHEAGVMVEFANNGIPVDQSKNVNSTKSGKGVQL